MTTRKNTVPADRIYKRHVGRYFLSVIDTAIGPESAILQEGGDMMWRKAGNYQPQFQELNNVEQIESFIFECK